MSLGYIFILASLDGIVTSLPLVVSCLFVPPRTLAVLGHAMRFGLRVRLWGFPDLSDRVQIRPLTLCFNCCFILRHCIFDDSPSNLDYVCFVVFCNCLVVQNFFTQVTEGRTGRCVVVFIGKNMVMNNLVKMKRLSWSADANASHEVLIHVCKQIL